MTTVNLNTSPYFDDFDADKNYHQILFKPSTAVQVRELNQLQTILQNQISKFGDHILKRGVLLEGCQPTFFRSVPFVKLRDLTTNGSELNLSWLQDLQVICESTGLIARITDTVSGYEVNDPDLKTIYLEYLNSGTNGTESAFKEGDVLKFYSSDQIIYNVRVTNSAAAIQKEDRVVFTSALEITKEDGTTEGFNIEDGYILKQPDGKRVQVIGTPETVDGSIVLRVRPVIEDLASNGDSNPWILEENIETQVYQSDGETLTDTIVIKSKIGSGAAAALTVGIQNRVSRIDIINRGSGYYVVPHVSIAAVGRTVEPSVVAESVGAFAGIVENFLAQSQIPNTDTLENVNEPTTGFGYMMSVTSGSIYQKGYFIRVEPQKAIVAKYTNIPTDIAVGFETRESIVSASSDSSLFDNANGFTNQAAPGADRLKLTPTLVAKTFEESDEDPEFFPIFKFSEGRPYSQTMTAVYNKLGDELARRTFENSGNFVLNNFDITTRSTLDFAESAQNFSYVIDPGHAYINGHRVKTEYNFARNVSKAVATKTVNAKTDLMYGNYFLVNSLQGMVNHHQLEEVVLRNAGTPIGTARVRSLVLDQFKPGDASVYRLYVFNLKFNSGKSIKNLTQITGANSFTCELVDNRLRGIENNSLVFKHGYPAKSISETSYRFRTILSGSVATNGTITIAKKNGLIYSWPYSDALSFVEKRDLIVIPNAEITLTDGRVFQANKPIPMTDEKIIASVSGNDLNIDLGSTLTSLATSATVSCPQLRTSSSVRKDAKRNRIVKIDLSTSDAGTTGPWCLGVSDAFRLRKVEMGSDDVTLDFFVDSNQTENIYDLSYLYQRKTSNLNLSGELVVTLDIFDDSVDGGLQTVSSFGVDDTKTLSELGLSINTLEIPEVYSSRKNTFIDLREAFDFRPRVIPTATVTDVPASATVNPAETMSFDPTHDFEIPDPESEISYVVEYYENRVDGIAVTSDGRFNITQGRIPQSNDPNEFVIYSAIIPPYPTLPRILSLSMEEIYDTRVINVAGQGNRRKYFTITTEKVDQQVSRYTMADITQLERRIEVLEYYNNLSQIENEVKDLSLPSSIDSTLERFKYGFFVDNFADYSYSNTRDPFYNAGIYAFVLQPGKVSLNVPLEAGHSTHRLLDGSKVHFPSQRVRLLSQTNATRGPQEIEPDIEDKNVRRECSWITNRTNKFYRDDDNFSRQQMIFETRTFKLTTNPKAINTPIEISFNMLDGVDRIEFYQTTSLVKARQIEREIRNQDIANDNGAEDLGSVLPYNITAGEYLGDNLSNQILPLTTAEKRRLQNMGLRTRGGTIVQWTTAADFERVHGPGDLDAEFYVKGAGKITLAYNPNRGRYITIAVIKGTANYSMYVCYPVDEPTPPPPPPPPPITCIPGPETKQKIGSGIDSIVYYVSDGCSGRRVYEPIPKPPAPPPCVPPPCECVCCAPTPTEIDDDGGMSEEETTRAEGIANRNPSEAERQRRQEVEEETKKEPDRSFDVEPRAPETGADTTDESGTSNSGYVQQPSGSTGLDFPRFNTEFDQN